MTRTHRLRNAIIIGAQKSGTTSLFNYLKDHPEVLASVRKETNYFCDDDDQRLSLADYRKFWNVEQIHSGILLEASPRYTVCQDSVEVFRRMATVLPPDAKFIYLMRHPIPRTESRFRHLIRNFQTGVDEHGITEDVLAPSRYASQIQNFLQVFDRDRLLLLKFEDLQSDPANVLRRVCTFLEIDPTFEFPNLSEVYNAGITKPRLWRPRLWLRKRPRLHRTAKAIVPKPVQKRLHDVLAGESSLRHQLTAAERREIVAYLRPELQHLWEDHGIGWADSELYHHHEGGIRADHAG